MPEKMSKGDDTPSFGTRKTIDSDDSPTTQKSPLKSYMERKSRQMRDESAALGQSQSNDSSKSKDPTDSQPRANQDRAADAKTRDAENLEESARGEQRAPRPLKRNQIKDRAKTEEAFGEDNQQRTRKLSPKDRTRNEEGFGDGGLTSEMKKSTSASGDDT